MNLLKLPPTDDRDYLSMKETVTVSGLRKVSVEIVDDRAFEETQQFQVTLSAAEDVVFVNRNATITITDNDGTSRDRDDIGLPWKQDTSYGVRTG